MGKEQNSLPWNVVENAINKEIKWLKETLLIRSEAGILSFMEGKAPKCESCDYTYRKIALLIVTGKIKAREIKTQKDNDLWGGLTKIINRPIHKHGQDWHRMMMNVVDQYFTSQGYEVNIEPYLNYGRADLGIYKEGKKFLFVEIGTLSIYKLWVNLQTLKDALFLIVPSENKIIEFET